MSDVRDWMSLVADLGCLVDGCNSPANLHHIRMGQGMSQRSPDWLVVPLCKDHHQGGYSVHGSPDLFTKIEGTEPELLARTLQLAFKQLRQK